MLNNIEGSLAAPFFLGFHVVASTPTGQPGNSCHPQGYSISTPIGNDEFKQPVGPPCVDQPVAKGVDLA